MLARQSCLVTGKTPRRAPAGVGLAPPIISRRLKMPLSLWRLVLMECDSRQQGMGNLISFKR